MEINTFLNQW